MTVRHPGRQLQPSSPPAVPPTSGATSPAPTPPPPRRLTAGLVATMSAGNASDIVALEEEWLLPAGIPRSPHLQRAVQALTTLV